MGNSLFNVLVVDEKFQFNVKNSYTYLPTVAKNND